MNTREFTCVVCPSGCSIIADVDNDETPVITRVQGAICKKGVDWVHQEVENPQRTLASSVQVSGGDFRLASVRTTRPVQLVKIPLIMRELHRLTLAAPVAIGDVVLSAPSGCDTEIIATRNVRKIS